ncbi:MAG TPA: lytic transglycosylase domain-containing protein [Acidocella sp.]|nr:lytic transglycosylase domain-containing protein [Acidocella sp.]
MRLLGVLLLSCLPAAALAQTPASPQIMTDVKAGDFNNAETLAAATGDPLMVKLVTFFRLLDPGGGTPDEIKAFITANPDWPEQGLLALREIEASGLEAPSMPENTPPFLEQVKALHDAGNDIQAAALWAAQGKTAMAAADAGQQLMFWPDQNILARALLAEGDAKNAYQVVIAVNPPIAGERAREQIADRDFLAGFLLLRFLKEPAEAATWFTDLAGSSTAVITQARAWYWLGRSQTGAQAAADYARAAQYPNTYYGQLAALALGDTPQQLAARITATGEPMFTAQDALDFALMELPRAAVLLVQMEDTHDAAIFLNRLGQTAIDDRTRELAAKLALGLGIPQSAVAIARTAGTAGQMLVREGWPMPVTPPSGGLEPAIAYGIMRQESSFDSNAISGSGAIGLMQLMPATARLTARKAGLEDSNLFDPAQNMALGTAYLSELVQNFGDCLPLAIAAYNGGPTNVARWLTTYGDPELGRNPGGADIIDWVEEIPFSETRNYVQRVSESITIYRAFLTGSADDPLTRWMQK